MSIQCRYLFTKGCNLSNGLLHNYTIKQYSKTLYKFNERRGESCLKFVVKALQFMFDDNGSMDSVWNDNIVK